MSSFNELSSTSKKFISDKSGDVSKVAGSSSTVGTGTSKQTMTSIIAVCCFLLLISALAIVGQSNKSMSPAAVWSGNYKVRGELMYT